MKSRTCAASSTPGAGGSAAWRSAGRRLSKIDNVHLHDEAPSGGPLVGR